VLGETHHQHPPHLLVVVLGEQNQGQLQQAQVQVWVVQQIYHDQLQEVVVLVLLQEGVAPGHHQQAALDNHSNHPIPSQVLQIPTVHGVQGRLLLLEFWGRHSKLQCHYHGRGVPTHHDLFLISLNLENLPIHLRQHGEVLVLPADW
jgi:hypothetical protein